MFFNMDIEVLVLNLTFSTYNVKGYGYLIILTLQLFRSAYLL